MKTKICINTKYSSNAALRAFVDNIDDEMNRGGETIFSGRNIVKRFQISGFDQTIIVKRFRKPNALNRFIYGNIRATKAKRAYQNAFELIARGFSTPEPFAYVELSSCGVMGVCYYLSSECCYAPICDKLNPPDFDKSMADAFAKFVAQLHTKGVVHCDLNSTNVLYNIENGDVKFELIDINRMKFFDANKVMPIDVALDNLTLFTGDMDVFTYVATRYVDYRALPKSTVEKALERKNRHDVNYKRKRKFSRLFK
ncbi:MAG: hypothetical protein K6G73_03520 [Marinilabiliaceae bacterium]|nr:hypothetical protein [Marinilabiliaceae bacterium]